MAELPWQATWTKARPSKGEVTLAHFRGTHYSGLDLNSRPDMFREDLQRVIGALLADFNFLGSSAE